MLLLPPTPSTLSELAIFAIFTILAILASLLSCSCCFESLEPKLKVPAKAAQVAPSRLGPVAGCRPLVLAKMAILKQTVDASAVSVYLVRFPALI